MIGIIILMMQFFDSYCAELFGKLQSFLLTDFLIVKENMSVNAAVSYMGYATLPFYVIPMLAPLARTLVDRIGIKLMFIGNIIVLVSGCIICSLSDTLLMYLIGNGIVIFASTMDIQYIYIAEIIPENRRATMRGICGGVAAVAAMLIPICRTYFADDSRYGWRYMYLIGILLGVVTFIVSLFLKHVGRSCADKLDSEVGIDRENYSENASRKKHILNGEIKYYMLILFILGIATSGITSYNEPMLSFAVLDENSISIALMVQPLATLLVNVFSGVLADMAGRRKIIIANLILTILSVVVFVSGVNAGVNVICLGLAWGCMIGSYFCVANLITLTVMELAKDGTVGKVSAISTYVNGTGNAIGILLCTVLVKYTGMAAIKLITTIPVLIITALMLMYRNSGSRSSHQTFHGKDV